MSFHYGMKFIVVGDAGCGKSSLMRQFTDKDFEENRTQTIGVEFCTRNIVIQNKVVQLQIWDTAGQDRFYSIVKQYYRGSAVAFVVYDITRRQTFHHVTKWLSDAKNLTSEHTIIHMIGNKLDLAVQREVSYEEAAHFAEQNGIVYTETSAKTGEAVEEVFLNCAKKVYEKMMNGVLDTNNADSGIFENKPVLEPVEEPKKNCFGCKG